jgi:hypothetical protein
MVEIIWMHVCLCNISHVVFVIANMWGKEIVLQIG